MSQRLAPAEPRVEFPRSVRKAALERANGHCEGCGRPLVRGRYTFDHTVPARRGGPSTLANCKVLCNDGEDSCDYRKTYGEDLPGIAANKRYGKNRLPLDIDRPEKKPSTFKGNRGFQQGHRSIPSRPFPKKRQQ